MRNANHSPGSRPPRLSAPAGVARACAAPPADETALVEALRRGDDAAFSVLVESHTDAMLRVARRYTRDVALAEDAVQDAWLGVLHGIGRFQGRASLRTWILGIFLNRLRTTLRRERRTRPLDTIVDGADRGAAGGRRRHGCAADPAPPPSTEISPEAGVLLAEARALLLGTIARLPRSQRMVITLRDLDGWSGDEVCGHLSISPPNQRVLLHRARCKVRKALREYFADA